MANPSDPPDDLDFEPAALDRFLEAAYAPAADPGHAESVLLTLEPITGSTRRIQLRDAEAPAAPLPAPTGRVGRYEVLGEIARGGLGMVLAGRDVDLGREVALKMLLDRHAGSAAMTRRLLEEAQIGGQLQHPGIVPVYDVGLSEDLRPYFSMKRVRGLTLAQLLAARTHPAEDRMRWLSAFEQACHAVAYAHARGVVHRDLKPGNVMVGSFGEVQVVDWGLALRLDDAADAAASEAPDAAATAASSIAGTPAYMAPEQARGAGARIDERTDVFGLGAILCEILTGRPPYGPGTGEVVRAQAARGELAPALAALAATDAGAELLDLTRACLAPDPEQRPRNAAAVAERIAAYRASVEARARASEVAAVGARAEAAEQRAHALEAQAAAARERQRRQRVVLAAVALLFLVLVGAGLWVAISAEQRARLQRAMADIGHGMELMAKDQYEAAASVFRAVLDEQPELMMAHVSLGRALSLKRDWPAAEAALRRALRVERRPSALAMLAVVLREQGRIDESAALLEEAERIKPDDGEVLAGLGMTRTRQGRLDEALRYLKRVADAEPEMALFQVEIARVYKLKGDQEACERALREALRLDPRRQAAHSGLLEIEARKGNLEAAVGHGRRAVELAPDDLGARNNLAAVLYMSGQHDAAVEVARATLERDRKSGRAWHLLGAALERGNHFVEAADAYRHAVDLGVKDARVPLQDCQLMVSLEPRLPALLAGTDQPKDEQEAMAIARFCKARLDLQAAARFYELAFASGKITSDVQSHPYHHAAQAAVRCGFGVPASPEIPADAQAAHWRQRALEWLGIELDAAAPILAQGNAEPAQLLSGFLRSLRSDPELAVLRDAIRLARLGDAERSAVKALWERLDQLLGGKR